MNKAAYFIILHLVVAVFSATASYDEIDPEVLANGTWKITEVKASSSNSVVNGSAFPIFENYFLTAGHVVYKSKNEFIDFILNNRASIDAQNNYKDVSGKVIYIGCEKYINSICMELDDIALIKADMPRDADIVRFDISFEAKFRYPFRGSSAGYPADSELLVFAEGQYSIQNLKDVPDFKGRFDVFDSIPIYYLGNSASASGESGGPVLLTNSNHKAISLISMNLKSRERSSTTFTVNNMVIVKAISKLPIPDYLKKEYSSWGKTKKIDDVRNSLSSYSNIELYLLSKYILDGLSNRNLEKAESSYMDVMFELLLNRKIDYTVVDFEQYVRLDDGSHLKRDLAKASSRLADYYRLVENSDMANVLYTRAETGLKAFFIKNRDQILSKKSMLNDVVDQLSIVYSELGRQEDRVNWIALGAFNGLPNQLEQLGKLAYWNREYEDATTYYKAASEILKSESKPIPSYIDKGLNLSIQGGQALGGEANAINYSKKEVQERILADFSIVKELNGSSLMF